MPDIIKSLKSIIADPACTIAYDDLLTPLTPDKYRAPTPDATPAGVMICLYQKANSHDFFFSLIKRKVVKGDKHSGQISLPGGRYEEEDGDLKTCALRETEEEISIPREKINVIGELSELFVYASNFIVYPFVGYLNEEVKLVPEQREVQRIIEVSMSQLIRPNTVQYTNMKLSEGTLKNVPYYNIDGEIVWGATAIILSEFVYYWKLSI